MANDGLSEDKPMFTEGQKVFFDTGGGPKGYGKIRGISTTGLVDFWIVEMDMVVGVDRTVYPWSCITVSHYQIKTVDPAAEVSIPSLRVGPPCSNPCLVPLLFALTGKVPATS